MINEEIMEEVKGIAVSVLSAFLYTKVKVLSESGRPNLVEDVVDSAEALFDELNKRGHLDAIGGLMAK